MKKHHRYLRWLGPGFVTGFADDDPSGLGTYSQTGAQFGYSQLWVMLFSLPFMTVIQEMCGRVGLVTGRGLAAVIRIHYGRKLLYGAIGLLLAANTINIGADLGAMASSGALLIKLPFVYWLIAMTVVCLLLQVLVPYKVYAQYLKWLTLTLFAYFIAAFVVHQDWGRVLHDTIVPHISLTKDYLLNIVALLGTTISPYLFFWQADEEVEEEILHHQVGITNPSPPRIGPSDLRRMRNDTMVGMGFSQLIAFFVIATAAATLGAHGIGHVQTADQAAKALQPLAGNFTYLLFAAGIIGAGLLAVPVLAGSASYALSEAFGWKEGLYRKFRQAHGFYGVITIATLLGLLVNFTPIQPFQLLYYTAIFNGLCAPPLLVLILLITNNSTIMGEHTNGRWHNYLGGFITVVMTLAGMGLIISLLK